MPGRPLTAKKLATALAMARELAAESGKPTLVTVHTPEVIMPTVLTRAGFALAMYNCEVDKITFPGSNVCRLEVMHKGSKEFMTFEIESVRRNASQSMIFTRIT